MLGKKKVGTGGKENVKRKDWLEGSRLTFPMTPLMVPLHVVSIAVLLKHSFFIKDETKDQDYI